MSDKLYTAREYILRKIENGELAAGQKLPAAREICDDMGVSLAIAQMAFNSLTREGILNSVSRQGTYVRHDWMRRILPGSFRTMRDFWKDMVTETVLQEIPGIRICHQFWFGLFELRTTLDVQWRQDQYLDLTEFFDRAYPDKSDFFLSQFRPFYSRSGKLYAIPLIFSPWVVSYNEDMLLKAGAKIPGPEWSWEEFIDLIRTLRGTYSAQDTFHFIRLPSFWTNFLFRAGGAIIDRQDDQPSVKLDTPQSLNALRKIKELYDALEISVDDWPYTDARQSFYDGKCALALTAREDVDFNADYRWGCVPLPAIDKGVEACRQAADLLCVRSQVSDFEQVTQVIRLLLSQKVQDQIGATNYGIPVRRSSAIHSFRENDPRDGVFFSNMTRIIPDYNFAWPELYSLASKGLSTIWERGADVEEVVSELTPVLKSYIKYEILSG